MYILMKEVSRQLEIVALMLDEAIALADRDLVNSSEIEILAAELKEKLDQLLSNP
jgi:hypothetical protein